MNPPRNGPQYGQPPHLQQNYHPFHPLNNDGIRPIAAGPRRHFVDPYEDLIHASHQARAFPGPPSDVFARSRDTSYGTKHPFGLVPHQQVPPENFGYHHRQREPQNFERDQQTGMPVLPIRANYNPNAIPQRPHPPGYGEPEQPRQQMQMLPPFLRESGQQQQQQAVHLQQQQQVVHLQQQQGDPIGSALRERENREISFFNPGPQPLMPMPPSRAAMSVTGAGSEWVQLGRGEYMPDQRNGLRLKKLLGAPEEKELWLETRTGCSTGRQIAQVELEEDKPYFYNAVTLQVTFDRPSPAHAYVMGQSECQKMLDMITPCTLIAKRINHMTEDVFRAFFEQFGPVAFARVCRLKDVARNNNRRAGSSRILAYFRMETVQAQRKILEQIFYVIDGNEVEIRVPANRIFVGRVPDRTGAKELQRFFSEEIGKIDPNGYAIDAYFPLPYRQFAFVTVGGPQMGPKLALKADYFFRNISITVASCHSETEMNAEQLFEQKMQQLVERNELARLRSMQNISAEVKFLLRMLAKMKRFENQLNLLMELNTEFLKCTEEKLRNYLFVQDHVLDVCRLVAMNKEEENSKIDPLTRKRTRLHGPHVEGGEGEEQAEGDVEEAGIEDFTADSFPATQLDEPFITSATAPSLAKKPAAAVPTTSGTNAGLTAPEATTTTAAASDESITHIMRIMTKFN